MCLKLYTQAVWMPCNDRTQKLVQDPKIKPPIHDGPKLRFIGKSIKWEILLS